MYKKRNVKSLFTLTSVLVLFSLNAFAEFPDEFYSIDDKVETTANCGQGSRGWWLKLEFSKYNRYQEGWVSTSSGQYGGCGTCGDCRAKLNQDIDQILAREEQICVQRGGETKAVDRGAWTEDIQSNSWTIRASNVGITCEKWIPCGN